MIAFAIISILLLISVIITSLIIDEVNDCKPLPIIIGTLQIIAIFGLVALYINKDADEPKAIDVYRGNTTLQITYQDSIPVDSVVVFKIQKL